MQNARRVILFILGVVLLLSAIAADPVHLSVLLAALLLLGVVTWEQIEAIIRRNGTQRHSNGTTGEHD